MSNAFYTAYSKLIVPSLPRVDTACAVMPTALLYSGLPSLWSCVTLDGREIWVLRIVQDFPFCDYRLQLLIDLVCLSKQPTSRDKERKLDFKLYLLVSWG